MKRIGTNGALSRFRVLDLSQVRAGPTCVKQLADFGADVIKVEPPDSVDRQELYVGERDGADMINLHRNKRSITLDLKSPACHAILMDLVAQADVVVENFRPEVKARLGLDYDSLSRRNPRIILVSISGFGQDGPYMKRPGFDQILQGMCGLMSATGFADGQPVRAGAAVIDMVTGLYAALGAMTALLERQTSGRGQWVQCSLLHSGIALMDFQAARCALEGEIPERVGNDHPTSMPTSAYPTSNGHINVGAGGDKQWQALCRAIGQAGLAHDARFRSNADRIANRAELNAILLEAFSGETTETWMDRLLQADVPAGPIYRMDQTLRDPQVVHQQIIKTVPHPRRTVVSLIDQAIRLSRTPAQLHGTLEDKGGSNEDVLRELGYRHDAVHDGLNAMRGHP
ncbi:CaiB/BaiF CoA transferase family protein [Cupriavidus sp. 30B13]|uniref:CaiB/BaiF CoA transferase family protein n=1 Tax=Cupriavidus sp. 30B13 TaxID=3384241 RepID=UPI003B907576